MRMLLTLWILHLASLQIVAKPLPPVTALEFSPQGEWLAVGTYGEVTLLNLDDGQRNQRLSGPTQRVTAIAFDKLFTRLAVASGIPGKAGLIHLWHVGEKGIILEPNKPEVIPAHQDIIYALTFSPDGKLLASAGYDRVIELWDPATRKSVKNLKDHSDTVFALSFHPEGKLLASCAADRAVKVWDVVAGKRLYTLAEPTDWVYSVAWSNDGKQLAAGGIDKSIRVWNATAVEGKLAQSVFGHTQPITKLIYSTDGKSIYSISEGPTPKRWDSASMKESLIFSAQTETMLAMALRPNHPQLALGRFDGVVVLADTTTGKEVSKPFPPKPEPPKPTKVSPSFGQRGKTVRLRFEGGNLAGATELVSPLAGLSAKLVPESHTASIVEFDVTIPAQLPAGLLQFQLRSPEGSSAKLDWIVDRYPAMVDSEQPADAKIVKLPTTIVGTIGKAGEVKSYRLALQKDQELGIQILTTNIGSKLDAVVELRDRLGKKVCESNNNLFGYIVPESGIYTLMIRDRDYRGNAELFYRLHAGPIPIVTGVFPLGMQRGTTQTIQLRGVNLADRRSVKMSAAADALPGSTLNVPLAEMQGEMPLGNPKLLVGEFNETTAVGAAVQTISNPGTFNGVIANPGDSQLVSVSMKKGEKRIIEINARRIGSPLDSVIEIFDAQSKPLDRAALRCTARIFTIFRDHDSATPGIRLESWNELAMDDLLYVNGDIMKILDLPKNPDDDCQFYRVDGQRLAYLDTTPLHHSNGTAMYKIELHPPGSTFPANGMPVFQLPYRNDDGGPGYGKDSRLIITAPYTGEYKIRIGDARGFGGSLFAYRLTVRELRPDFSVRFDPTSPIVPRGGSIPINVTATRIDGYDGPIAVRLHSLPIGIDSATGIIEAGQTTTTLSIFANQDAPQPPKTGSIELLAEAEIDGKKVTRRASGMLPQIVDPGDIVTTTMQSDVVLNPGGQSRIRVKVERRNGFTGRIPVEVRGLPHGVRVLDIGLNGILITEQDREREIVIFAEPWVKPMTVPMAIWARNEKKGSLHGAKEVMLKIEK